MRLTRQVAEILDAMLERRFALPIEWEFGDFTLDQFKSLSKMLYAMAFMHLQSRSIAVARSAPYLGIENSVLTIGVGELKRRFRACTNIKESVIGSFLRYLTYGGEGQNVPDPALQPIIPLQQGLIALAPAIVCSSSLERNFAVLLNRVDDTKTFYAALSSGRENLMRDAILDGLSSTSLRFWNGNVNSWEEAADLDLVIICDQTSTILVLELKSFIAPAEPKEIINRSEEIGRGISQIVARRNKFDVSPLEFFSLTETNTSYEIFWSVVSENSIGANYVQRDDCPVVNRAHFVRRALQFGNFRETALWLKERRYLPVPGRDFEEVPFLAQVGRWRGEWYGLRITGSLD